LADDVAQETCVAIFNVLPTYERHGAPFAAWVYAIAANKVADVQRKHSRAALLVDEFPDQVEPSPTPEEQVMASALLQVAAELVGRLSPRMREVLLMRAGGSSADAVGNELGLTPGAVRVVQHRAVAKLRKLVNESEEYRELFAASLSDSPRSRPLLSA
jgi:RNA polymerase sigma-70 factor (ECF subfamily)